MDKKSVSWPPLQLCLYAAGPHFFCIYNHEICGKRILGVQVIVFHLVHVGPDNRVKLVRLAPELQPCLIGPVPLLLKSGGIDIIAERRIPVRLDSQSGAHEGRDVLTDLVGRASSWGKVSLIPVFAQTLGWNLLRPVEAHLYQLCPGPGIDRKSIPELVVQFSIGGKTFLLNTKIDPLREGRKSTRNRGGHGKLAAGIPRILFLHVEEPTAPRQGPCALWALQPKFLGPKDLALIDTGREREQRERIGVREVEVHDLGPHVPALVRADRLGGCPAQIFRDMERKLITLRLRHAGKV